MREDKVISIPSLTEGKDPYKVTIPVITALHHRSMIMLETAYQIQAAREGVVDADETLEEAIAARDDLVEVVEALEESGVNSDIVISKKQELGRANRTVARFEKNRDKLESLLKKDAAKVEKHFGSVPEFDIQDLEVTYLLIGKGILGEPWAVMACCDLGPEDWVDIAYEDYEQICKELLKRNIGFLKVRHPNLMAKK